MGKGKSKKQCVLAIIDNCVLVALIWMEVAKKEVWLNTIPPYFLLIKLLHRQQFTVHSVMGCKFCMRPILYKSSFVHHNNLISIANGLQVVGNDQDCAISGTHGRLKAFVSALRIVPTRFLRFLFHNLPAD